MAREPLAIRTHQNITSISIGRLEHRLALFADDVIIFLKNVEKSIPELLELINVFGNISGYKLNKSTSSIMFLNQLEHKNPPEVSTQFKIVDCFTYLGIKITPQLKYIVASNYEPLMQEISKSLDRWTPIPMSLIGKINVKRCQKMNILPKLLYLFQNLPLPSNLFTLLKKTVKFLWNNRHPQTRLSLLYLPFLCCYGLADRD